MEGLCEYGDETSGPKEEAATPGKEQILHEGAAQMS
jgi:hypothetical protein